MGIIVNGQVNSTATAHPLNSVSEPQIVRSSPSENIPHNSGPINPLNYVKAEARADVDPEKAYILVNGKVKEISKKSQYLFDMITK